MAEKIRLDGSTGVDVAMVIIDPVLRPDRVRVAVLFFVEGILKPCPIGSDQAAAAIDEADALGVHEQ
jgi:hypothetical protein